MPNIKSAIKRVQLAKKNNVLNNDAKTSMKTAIKNIEKASLNNQKENMPELLQIAYKRIDKALKANIIKPNTAARYKSRLSKMVNKK